MGLEARPGRHQSGSAIRRCATVPPHPGRCRSRRALVLACLRRRAGGVGRAVDRRHEGRDRRAGAPGGRARRRRPAQATAAHNLAIDRLEAARETLRRHARRAADARRDLRPLARAAGRAPGGTLRERAALLHRGAADHRQPRRGLARPATSSTRSPAATPACWRPCATGARGSRCSRCARRRPRTPASASEAEAEQRARRSSPGSSPGARRSSPTPGPSSNGSVVEERERRARLRRAGGRAPRDAHLAARRELRVGGPGAARAAATSSRWRARHSFSDDWLAPRPGGRSHQGIDLFAARGHPDRRGGRRLALQRRLQRPRRLAPVGARRQRHDLLLRPPRQLRARRPRGRERLARDRDRVRRQLGRRGRGARRTCTSRSTPAGAGRCRPTRSSRGGRGRDERPGRSRAKPSGRRSASSAASSANRGSISRSTGSPSPSRGTLTPAASSQRA